MYSNQTGKFPITSAQSHKYIMVAVTLDGNCIDAKEMKTHSTESPNKAYKDGGNGMPQESFHQFSICAG